MVTNFLIIFFMQFALADECVVGPVVRSNLPENSKLSCNEVTEHLKKTKKFSFSTISEKPSLSLFYDSDLALIPFEDLESLFVGGPIGRGEVLANPQYYPVSPQKPGYPEFKKMMDRKSDNSRFASWDFVKNAKNLKELAGFCPYSETQTLSHMTKLEDLNLTDCTFKTWPAIGNLTNLKVLRLHSYNIKSFPADYLANQVNLEELYLNSNPIKSLPVGFFKNLKKLKKIEIMGTELTKEEIVRIKSELKEVSPALKKRGAMLIYLNGGN